MCVKYTVVLWIFLCENFCHLNKNWDSQFRARISYSDSAKGSRWSRKFATLTDRELLGLKVTSVWSVIIATLLTTDNGSFFVCEIWVHFCQCGCTFWPCVHQTLHSDAVFYTGRRELRNVQLMVKRSSLSLFPQPSNHSGGGVGQIPHWPTATFCLYNINRWWQQQA